MKCKYLSKKINGNLKCNKLKRDIMISKCKNCKYKDFNNKICTKPAKNCSKLCKKQLINQKSNKLAKLERNRFSILVSSTECCMCPATTDLTWHEVFRGRNRANSMKYGLCLRLCENCHKKYQENKEFNNYWHKFAQKRFLEYYHKDLNEFIDIFKKNYL